MQQKRNARKGAMPRKETELTRSDKEAARLKHEDEIERYKLRDEAIDRAWGKAQSIEELTDEQLMEILTLMRRPLSSFNRPEQS